MYFLLLLLTLLLPLVTPTHTGTATPCLSNCRAHSQPLGINCRGSSECTDVSIFHYGWNYNVIHDFYNVLAFGNGTIPGGPVSPLKYFQPKTNIVCNTNRRGIGAICLFLQGNVPLAGITAEVLLVRLVELADHGCQLCGSVPLSGDNNPNAEGILTINYVTNDSCRGVCPT